jgi:hypothetical protein
MTLVALASKYCYFEGKRFKRVLKPFPTKPSARRMAKTLRAKGNLARVVLDEIMHKWTVWYRKKQ